MKKKFSGKVNIMRYYDIFLLEARRKRILSSEYLLSLKNNENVMIHFSDVEKVGIYPIKTYTSTPLGIYGYPLKQIFDHYGNTIAEKLHILPFASEREYVSLIFVDENARKVYMDEKISSEDVKKIKKYFEEEIYYDRYAIEKAKKINFEDYEITLEDVSKFFLKYFNEYSSYGTILENFNDYLSFFDPEYMNYFFRKILGYTYLIDPGTGSIYDNEPIQSVLLDPRYIEKYEVYDNPASEEKRLRNLLKRIDTDFLNKDKISKIYQIYSEDMELIITSKKRDTFLRYLKNFLFTYLYTKNKHDKIDNYYEKYKKIFDKMFSEKVTGKFELFYKFSKLNDEFLSFLFDFSLIHFIRYYYYMSGHEMIKGLTFILSKIGKYDLIEKFFNIKNFSNPGKVIEQAFQRILLDINHNSKEEITPEYLDLIFLLQNENVIKQLNHLFHVSNSFTPIKIENLNLFYSMFRNFYHKEGEKTINVLEKYIKINFRESKKLKKHLKILKIIYSRNLLKNNNNLYEIVEELTNLSDDDLTKLYKSEEEIRRFSVRNNIKDINELMELIQEILR